MALIIWTGTKGSFNPTNRTNIKNPIYTIGNLNYQKALSEQKNIVKFGRMFWGIYPGGLTFISPSDAITFVENNQSILDQFSTGWAIYELSGEQTLGSGPINYEDSLLA